MSTLILIIIFLMPVAIIAMCFIVALGKRPGNRRRNVDLFYDGPERRCKFRDACPVGKICRDPTGCLFDQPRRDYHARLNLRNETPPGAAVV